MKGELIALLAPDCNQFFREFCQILSKLGEKKETQTKELHLVCSFYLWVQHCTHAQRIFVIHQCCQWRFPLQQSQMAEQGRTTAGATGSRGRLTSSKLCNTSYWESYCDRVQGEGANLYSELTEITFITLIRGQILMADICLNVFQTKAAWTSLLSSDTPAGPASQQTRDRSYFTGPAWTMLTTLSLGKCQSRWGPTLHRPPL